jgi:hypothetical protein
MQVEKQDLKTQNGKPVATAETEELADELANRLNEQAHQEEQDRCVRVSLMPVAY